MIPRWIHLRGGNHVSAWWDNLKACRRYSVAVIFLSTVSLSLHDPKGSAKGEGNIVPQTIIFRGVYILPKKGVKGKVKMQKVTISGLKMPHS